MRTTGRICYLKQNYFQGAIRNKKDNWKYTGVDYVIKEKQKALKITDI